MPEPYNPLDKLNLGKSVLDALLEQTECPLAALPKFGGAGIYAVYYRGDFEPYESIAAKKSDLDVSPIYVGKAIPAGSRKGASLSVTSTGHTLWRRLIDHRDSIASVETAGGNLALSDFSARYLVVDDIWIPLGESLLISTYSPIWNTVVDGFGNHDPGAGRYNGLRPMWDVLHPGRVWADKCRARSQSRDDLINLINGHFAK